MEYGEFFLNEYLRIKFGSEGGGRVWVEVGSWCGGWFGEKGGRLEDGWRMEDGKGLGLRIKKTELTTC